MEPQTNGVVYGRETIITMEIMSNYFVDIFYNELYAAAKQRKASGESPTVTDGYKHALQAWLQSLDNPIIYKKIRQGLYTCYVHYASFLASWDKCIDRMVTEFVPEGYIESMTSTHKINVLNRVVKQSNREMILRIAKTHLPIIIDSHTADNAQILKKEMVNLLLMERDKMFRQFIAPAKASGTGGSSVSAPVIDRLEEQVKQLLRERYDLSLDIVKLKRIANKYATQAKTLLEENATLKRKLATRPPTLIVPSESQPQIWTRPPPTPYQRGIKWNTQPTESPKTPPSPAEKTAAKVEPAPEPEPVESVDPVEPTPEPEPEQVEPAMASSMFEEDDEFDFRAIEQELNDTKI